MVVLENVGKEVLPKLKKLGYALEKPKTLHEEARLVKGKMVLVLYHSGKLLLQGEETEVKKVAIELKKLKIGESTTPENYRSESGWIIGSDESLKGDTFGGIVVAAVKANEEISIYYVAATPADSAKNLGPTESELKDYFSRNSLAFKQPLSFNLDYLMLDSQEKIQEVPKSVIPPQRRKHTTPRVPKLCHTRSKRQSSIHSLITRKQKCVQCPTCNRLQ